MSPWVQLVQLIKPRFNPSDHTAPKIAAVARGCNWPIPVATAAGRHVRLVGHCGHALLATGSLLKRLDAIRIDLLASIVICLTLVFHRWRYGRHVFDHKERCHARRAPFRPTSE
jgi:hypothetical protein